MAIANWLATDRTLSPLALTVLAQAIPPNDQGTLSWPIFFPRVDVPGIDLLDVTTVDYRPTAERREWDARGKHIPNVVPPTRPISIIPVEANDKIGELEMQRITERATGVGGVNQEIFRAIVGASIPARVDKLVRADYRRVEVDAMKAWATGTIIQRLPEDATKTYTASFGFSSGRYVTAGTAWNDVSVNAYDQFLAAVVASQDLVGLVEAAMMRLATFNAILDDAPDLANGVKMTRADLTDRLIRDLGQPFDIVINENSVDVFNDGGTAYTRTKLWTAQKVAMIPAGRVIGRTAFAPVKRAMDLVGQVGPMGVDVNGVTVYYDEANNGRELTIEAQVNALPIPDEQKLYIVDAGV